MERKNQKFVHKIIVLKYQMMAFLLILSGGIHKLIKKRFITSTKGEKLDKNQQNNI